MFQGLAEQNRTEELRNKDVLVMEGLPNTTKGRKWDPIIAVQVEKAASNKARTETLTKRRC